MQLLGLIVTVLALTTAVVGFECTGERNYDWPRDGSCWKYYTCKEGSTKPETGWCFPLIRRFSEDGQRCEWFFQTKCDLNPGPPPTPSVPTTQPTTQSTTTPTPTTKPTTEPTTKPTPTTQPTTQPTPQTSTPSPTTAPSTMEPATTKKPDSEAEEPRNPMIGFFQRLKRIL